MKSVQNGFTLIELMIVVAIVGILAAITIPVYNDYAVRSKMSEPLSALASCKSSVQEYAAIRGSWPTDVSSAGCSQVSTPYLASLTIDDGGIITAHTQATGAGACDVILTAQGSVSAITGWLGSTTCNPKFVPTSFRG